MQSLPFLSYFFEIHFNIILPSVPRSFMRSVVLRFPHQNFCVHFSCSRVCRILHVSLICLVTLIMLVISAHHEASNTVFFSLLILPVRPTYLPQHPTDEHSHSLMMYWVCLIIPFQITKKFSQIEATAFLLEKMGDFQGAVSLMLEKLQSLLAAETAQSLDTDELCRLSNKCVNLCQRGSSMLDEKSRQTLWFPVLETLMLPQRSEKPLHLSCKH